MVGKLDSNSVKIKYPGNTPKGGTKVLEVRIETDSEVLVIFINYVTFKKPYKRSIIYTT
jgi:hypothetical protein